MSDEVPGQAPAPPAASPPAVDPPLAPPVDAAAPDPAKAQEPAAPVIPDKYEFKLAEGRNLDAGLVDAITPVLKELGITQENASKLVAVYDKYGEAFEAAQEKQFKDFMEETTKANRDSIKKEWGNEHDANLTIAQRGIARFLSDAGKQKLEDSALGNDPEFLKMFLTVGKMIQEDRPPPAGTATGRKPTEAVLYPSMQ